MTVTTPVSNPYKRLCQLAERRLTAEQRIREAIEIGRAYLGVGRGVLAGTEDDQYEIRATTGDDVPREAVTDLEDTWCRHVLENGAVFGFAAVDDSPYREDRAREATGDRCYLGVPIAVDGETVGTLSFSDSEPRPEPITGTEREFVAILGHWVGDELERQRRLTDLRERNERLDEFAGIVAHDLRNPLSGAIGYTEFAQEQASGEVAEFLAHIQESLDQTVSLLSQCLVLAQDGADIGECEPVDLAAVARSTWETIERRNATLTVEADSTILADEIRLRQLFDNLFDNAVKHGGHDVAVTVSDRPGGFAVANDGPGLPPAVEAAISRNDIDRLKSFGLGLAIVSRIADGHGWELTAASSPEGVTIAVTGVTSAEPTDRPTVTD